MVSAQLDCKFQIMGISSVEESDNDSRDVEDMEVPSLFMRSAIGSDGNTSREASPAPSRPGTPSAPKGIRGRRKYVLTQESFTSFTDPSSGITYYKGDTVYLEGEDPNQPYYVCGAMDFRQTKKGEMVIHVRWYYRPSEVPYMVYKTLVQDRYIENVSGAELVTDDPIVKARELFTSDSSDYQPVSNLRGKCTVQQFADLQAARAFVPQQDHFFYILTYHPQSKRLATTQGEIRIGASHQAKLPECRPDTSPNSVEERLEDWEELVWQPKQLQDTDLIMYLRAARSMAAFAGMCDGGSTDDGCAAASMDDTTINAMDTLHVSDYKTGDALQNLVSRPIPLSIDKKWTEEETKNFVKGLRQHGKDFFKIKIDHLPNKDTCDLVEYYYIWKKSAAATNNRPHRRNRRNVFKRQTSRNTPRPNSDASSASELSDNDSDDSESRDSYMCRRCFTRTSKSWHHGGKERSWLCHSCRMHFKKYGEDSVLDEDDEEVDMDEESEDEDNEEEDDKAPPFMFKPVKEGSDTGSESKTRHRNSTSSFDTGDSPLPSSTSRENGQKSPSDFSSCSSSSGVKHRNSCSGDEEENKSKPASGRSSPSDSISDASSEDGNDGDVETNQDDVSSSDSDSSSAEPAEGEDKIPNYPNPVVNGHDPDIIKVPAHHIKSEHPNGPLPYPIPTHPQHPSLLPPPLIPSGPLHTSPTRSSGHPAYNNSMPATGAQGNPNSSSVSAPGSQPVSPSSSKPAVVQPTTGVITSTSAANPSGAPTRPPPPLAPVASPGGHQSARSPGPSHLSHGYPPGQPPASGAGALPSGQPRHPAAGYLPPGGHPGQHPYPKPGALPGRPHPSGLGREAMYPGSHSPSIAPPPGGVVVKQERRSPSPQRGPPTSQAPPLGPGATHHSLLHGSGGKGPLPGTCGPSNSHLHPMHQTPGGPMSSAATALPPGAPLPHRSNPGFMPQQLHGSPAGGGSSQGLPPSDSSHHQQGHHSGQAPPPLRSGSPQRSRSPLDRRPSKSPPSSRESSPDMPRSPTPEPRIVDEKFYQSENAIFLKHIWRGYNTCSRCDFEFRPKPNSRLALKRERSLSGASSNSTHHPHPSGAPSASSHHPASSTHATPTHPPSSSHHPSSGPPRSTGLVSPPPRTSSRSSRHSDTHRPHQSSTPRHKELQSPSIKEEKLTDHKRTDTPPQNTTADAQVVSNVLPSHHLSPYERGTPRPGPMSFGPPLPPGYGHGPLHDPTPALRHLSDIARPHTLSQERPPFPYPGGPVDPYRLAQMYPPGSRERLELELQRDKQERDERERELRERQLRDLEFREKMKQELEMKPPGFDRLAPPAGMDPVHWAAELQRRYANLPPGAMMPPPGHPGHIPGVYPPASLASDLMRQEQERIDRIGPPPGHLSQEQAMAERLSAERLQVERMAMSGDPLARLHLASGQAAAAAAAQAAAQHAHTHTHAHSHTHLHLHQQALDAAYSASLLAASGGAPPPGAPGSSSAPSGPIGPGGLPPGHPLVTAAREQELMYREMLSRPPYSSDPLLAHQLSTQAAMQQEALLRQMALERDRLGHLPP